MKNANELKEMTIDELQNELLTMRKEAFNLRLKKASGALDKGHLVKQVRRTVARIKTIMTEKVGKGHD